MTDAARFAGLEWTRWLFAIRIWAAVCVALGVAFWLELDGASSAGVCVAILALQTRGQVIEKAVSRMLGTVIGAIASIAITAAFSQSTGLFVIFYSAWLALCVFAASFLDGNRAYAAVLCGYTVSIVAVAELDYPDQVFSVAVSRAAAILIGILAITLVNSLSFVPAATPRLMGRMRAAQAQVNSFTARLTHPGDRRATDAEAAQILRLISDRHQEISLLLTETLVGVSHAAAVRASASALVAEVAAARQLSALGLEQGDELNEIVHRQLLRDLDDYQSAERRAADALEAGDYLPHAPDMPIYRSWENALRNALRALVASALSGFGLVLCGWPASSLAWEFVGIVICLSVNAPDPRTLARAALIAMPSAVMLAGVTLFVLLDGNDAFPLLCIGLAPAVIGGTLLLASPKPASAVVGSLLTVFTLVVIAPSNPQSYDPMIYVTTGLLMTAATVIVFVLANILFPVVDADRRSWVLRAARHALEAALRGAGARSEAEARLLDASRIATLSGLGWTAESQQAEELETIFWLTDLRAAVQRVWRGFAQLSAEGSLLHPSIPSAARTALLRSDVEVLRQMATALVGSGQPSVRLLGGHLALAAWLLESRRSGRAATGAAR
jgi:uncharacterized membrane protein YccC